MSSTTTDPSTSDLEIALPPRTVSLDQDEEWCVVHWDEEWQKVNMHDYGAIFSIPGLYEQLVYDVLDCRSPSTVCALLEEEIRAAGTRPGDINALDLGAGNGMVGEELLNLGAASVVGVDIIPEAKEAALRDRPTTYKDYHVVDMTQKEELNGLGDHTLNCLVCVAALGFGDIPPVAFLNAFKLIEPQGWVAFNIKKDFLGNSDSSGFSKLIWLLESTGAMTIRAKREYNHRKSTAGDPITYVAVVGRKLLDLPDGALASVN